MSRYKLSVLLFVLVVTGLVGIMIAGLFQSVPLGFTRFAARADSLVVYEGLPHQNYERELLAQERKTKETLELKGYPFYREPLELSEDDAEQLSAVLAKPSTWRPFTGEKKCGGFHPDYAVEFRRGSGRYLVLLCFGCGEAKLFGPLQASRYNMSLEARPILEKYQKNRPPMQKSI